MHHEFHILYFRFICHWAHSGHILLFNWPQTGIIYLSYKGLGFNQKGQKCLGYPVVSGAFVTFRCEVVKIVPQEKQSVGCTEVRYAFIINITLHKNGSHQLFWYFHTVQFKSTLQGTLQNSRLPPQNPCCLTPLLVHKVWYIHPQV